MEASTSRARLDLQRQPGAPDVLEVVPVWPVAGFSHRRLAGARTRRCARGRAARVVLPVAPFKSCLEGRGRGGGSGFPCAGGSVSLPAIFGAVGLLRRLDRLAAALALAPGYESGVGAGF